MAPEDIAKFNFLEAATRVYLRFTTGDPQYCIKPRALRWRKGDEPNVFLVKYRHSDQCVVAHVTSKQIIFKDRLTAKNLRQISFERILAYLNSGDRSQTSSTLMLPRVESE